MEEGTAEDHALDVVKVELVTTKGVSTSRCDEAMGCYNLSPKVLQAYGLSEPLSIFFYKSVRYGRVSAVCKVTRSSLFQNLMFRPKSPITDHYDHCTHS